MARKRLGEILIDAGVLTPERLKIALREQQKWGGPLGKVLVQEEFVTEEVLVRALAKQLNLPVVDLQGVRVEDDILQYVPNELAERHNLIPFRRQNNFLDVAMSDPMNMGILDELRIRTRMNLRPHLATQSTISKAIQRSYAHEMDIDMNFDDGMDMHILRRGGAGRGGRAVGDAELREAEITALQERVAKLESLVARDEDVIRKLLALLVQKGVATREEILEAIK